jgi:hypothetical protein
MGKIYSPPAEIPVPILDWKDVPAYDKACDKFIEDLRAYCVNRNNAEHVGEVIQFPVADGTAQYMVAALSPIQLVHIPLWDAWEFDYVSRLTKKDIVEKIEQRKAMDKFIQSRKG